MRSKFSLITFLVCALFLGACNSNGGNKKTEGDDSLKKAAVDTASRAQDCTTYGNFTIETKEGQGLVQNFDNVFIRTGKPDQVRGLLPSYWVDASVILAYSRFFVQHGTVYDGLWMYFGSLNNISTLMLVPTMPNGRKHANQFGQLIGPIPGTQPVFKNFDLTDTVWNNLTGGFNRQFKKYGMPNSFVDSLSNGVWFSQCVIREIANFITVPSNNVDGIRVLSAAYKDMHYNTNATQLKPVQSTVVIIATNPSSTSADGHSDNWDLFYQSLFKNPRFDAAFNHGELCPNNCN